MVDFTSGLDHFPDLTLYDLQPASYAESMAEIENVFDKMKLMGATEAVIATHMAPELGASAGQIKTSFTNGLRSLCDQAKARGITLYLQNRADRQRGSVPEVLALISEVGADNLRFALNTSRINIREAISQAGDRLGLVLASAPGPTVPSAQAPLSDGGVDLGALKGLQVPVVLDAVYTQPDEVFRDVKALWGNEAPTTPASQ
jgi:sugar phosphate isomerase/epimerase